MRVDTTSIGPFLTVCPSCRSEGKARPLRDGWGRHYLCGDCGAAWILSDTDSSAAYSAGSSTNVCDSATDTVVIVGLA